MATVLIFSEQQILAEGVACVLSSGSTLRLCGWCRGIGNLNSAVQRLHPDLLLIDAGEELPGDLLAAVREVALSCKVILWVRALSTDMVLGATSVGVRGILRKTLPTEIFVRCLRRIEAGELWFEKALTDILMTTRRYSLTPREAELVTLVSQGLRNREIALAMDISEGSVKVYLSRLMQKLEIKDRIELALFGLRNLNYCSGRMNTAPRERSPEWQAAGSFLVERSPNRSVS